MLSAVSNHQPHTGVLPRCYTFLIAMTTYIYCTSDERLSVMRKDAYLMEELHKLITLFTLCDSFLIYVIQLFIIRLYSSFLYLDFSIFVHIITVIFISYVNSHALLYMAHKSLLIRGINLHDIYNIYILI